MKVFVTGVTGYIGGSVAEHFVASGHQIVGLLRPTEIAKASLLQDRGIESVLGTLDADSAAGEYASSVVFNEDSYFEPVPFRRARVVTNLLVRQAGIDKGIRSGVICLP
jgi:NAD(P)-dependent dehydrogenase (short-subunit alcohol dehydrogenase family)